jgi:hypothetical protein
VNDTSLLGCPPTLTETGPLEAAEGTGATISVGLQLVGVATIPLNVTGPSMIGGSIVVVDAASAAVNARFQIWTRLIGIAAGKAGLSE